jgi:hypothetical protein
MEHKGIWAAFSNIGIFSFEIFFYRFVLNLVSFEQMYIFRIKLKIQLSYPEYFHFNRKALPMTTTSDMAINSAAHVGFKYPMAATGMATTL